MLVLFGYKLNLQSCNGADSLSFSGMFAFASPLFFLRDCSGASPAMTVSSDSRTASGDHPCIKVGTAPRLNGTGRLRGKNTPDFAIKANAKAKAVAPGPQSLEIRNLSCLLRMPCFQKSSA